MTILVWLPAADQEKVGWDGAALQIFGGVPGGAVDVGDGDEISPAQGAYLMHPDVSIAEGFVIGRTLQQE